jgi:phospholipase/carboxylesterase
MKTELNYIEQGQNLAQANKALILLHGRGGSAEDILTLAPYFIDETFYVIAPQAPNHTWYPYAFKDEDSKNQPQLSYSIEQIKSIIQSVAEVIPYEKIYLMGFSQGACLSLEISARDARKYGGIISFTGSLMGKEIDLNRYKGNFSGTKVFMANGTQDPFIPLDRTEESNEIFKRMGADVLFNVYKDRPHTVSEDEIVSVKNFIF